MFNVVYLDMTESNDYVNQSVELLRQLKRLMLSHNNMLSISASMGDVLSASIMLNQNVMISAIDSMLRHPATKVVQDITPQDSMGQSEKEGVLN